MADRPKAMSEADVYLLRRLKLLETRVQEYERSIALEKIAADGLCSGNVHVFVGEEGCGCVCGRWAGKVAVGGTG